MQAADRADVVQDALHALFRHESQTGAITDRFAWLGAVVRNLVALRRRANARRAEVNPRRVDESFAAKAGASPSIHEILAEASGGWTELEKGILQGLAAGESRQQLATELDVSVDSVDRAVKESLKKLRKYLLRSKE